MSGMTKVETVFWALLGRAPLPHEVQAYAQYESTPQELGLKLLAYPEVRKRAMIAEFTTESSKWVCSEIRNGLKLWVDLMDAGVSAGAIANNWELEETNFILSLLKQEGCFLDIGAHNGWFTILAAYHVGPRGKVYSFEPRQDIFNYLKKSVDVNGFHDRCTLYRAALSDKVSTTRMGVYSSEHKSDHTIMVVDQTPNDATIIEDTPTLTLDGLEWDRKIDLLKIGFEGAEAIILKGGVELLRRDHPIIINEVFPHWPHQVNGTSAESFIEILKNFGYRLFELTAYGIGQEIHNLDKADPLNRGYFVNIVCLTEEHIAEHLLGPLDGCAKNHKDKLKNLQIDFQSKIDTLKRQGLTQNQIEKDIASIRADFDGKVRVEQQQLAQIEIQIANLRYGFEDKTQSIQKRQKKNSEAEMEIMSLRADLETKTLYGDQQNLKLKKAETEISALRSNLAFHQETTEQQKQNQIHLRQEISNLQEAVAHFNTLQSSNAWRIFMVLVRIGRHIPPPLRRFLIRTAKLGWWSITGKLPQRVSQWRAFQRAQRVVQPPAFVQPAVVDQSCWKLRRGPVALIIDHCWPEPDRDSGSVDAINLVRQLLTLGFEVVFASAGNLVQSPHYESDLIKLGARTVPETGFLPIQKFIEENKDIFSFVVLSRVSCGGALFEHVRYNCPDAKIIFNSVDLHFLREGRAAQLTGDRHALAHAEQTRQREEFLTGKADLTIVVSDVEAEILSVAVPRAPILHLPLAREISLPTATFEARNRIGFIGGFSHKPNLDAIYWFLDQVWPLIRQKRPDIVFSIAGRGLPDNIAKPEEGVIYEGPIDDLHGWFETLIMSVAPLRIGAGAKGKVVSSLTNGIPCVVSAIAAEGMGLIDGTTALVAETREVFAEKIIELIEDKMLWHTLSKNGISYAKTHFSYEVNMHKLHKALIEIGVPVDHSTAAPSTISGVGK